MSTEDDRLTFDRIGKKIFNFFDIKPNNLEIKIIKGSLSIRCKSWIESNTLFVSFMEKFSDKEKASINFNKSSKNLDPSIKIESNRFKSSKDKDLKLSLTLLPSLVSFDANYKYFQFILHCQGSTVNSSSISAIYDVYNNNKLLFGTKIQQNNLIQFGMEYTYNINTMLSFKFSNQLNQYKFGIMKTKIFNNSKNTLYGQMEYKSNSKTKQNIYNDIQGIIGFNRKLNEEASIEAFINNNKYAFIGLNYCLFFNEYSTSKIDSNIGIDIDLQKQSFKPRYQCCLEWHL